MTIGVYILYWEDVDSVYIGQSISIEKRIRQHYWALSKNRHINYKLQAKYNEIKCLPNFYILETCDIHNLNTCESAWIREFDSIDKGLNIEEPTGTSYGSLKYSKVLILKAFRQLSLGLNMLSISEYTGINISTIRSIATGQNYTWLKQCYPFHYDRMQKHSRKSDSRAISAKGIEYEVRSPEGTLYKVHNISQFCKEHKLNIGNFHSMLHGKYLQCKGWHLSTTILERKPVLQLKSPDGVIYTVTNRNEFCKLHNLDTGSLSRLVSGQYSSTKGWVLSSS